MVQLYLNNELCDLYGKETIATDYSIAPISDISSRTSAKSITFKMPLTANNRAIIENANVIVNETVLPYRLVPAKLKANGLSQRIEFAQIKSIKDDIEVVLFGSNVDFYSIIKGLKLADLGSVWDHVWNLDNAYGSRNNTSGYVYAMIDFFSDSPHSLPDIVYINNSAQGIDVRGLLPSIYLHSIIERIITEAGFTVQGDFLTDANYRSVVIPCTDILGDIRLVQTVTFTSDGNPDALTIVADREGLTLKKGSRIEIRGGNDFVIAESTENVITDDPLGVGIEWARQLDGSGLFLFGTPNPTDPPLLFFGGFVSGRDYTITLTLDIHDDNDTGTTTFTTRHNLLTPTDIEEIEVGHVFGSYVPVASWLPDLKQSDLLKDTAQKFGLIFQVDNVNRVVHIRRFSEIIDNIPNAFDWSGKVDYSEKPEIIFDSDYAQRNRCVYEDDDTVTKPAGTDGEILVDNDNLDAEKDLFKSPFAASEQVSRLNGVSIAQIKIFTDLGGADEEIDDVEPRYLVVRTHDFSPSFLWTDGTDNMTDTSAPVTHFILAEQDFNAGFENNLLDYSADLIALIQRYKSVNMLLRLTPADINQIDFFIPVWIELNGQPGCYYYISKIKQFKVTEKESTEVELVKLNQ